MATIDQLRVFHDDYQVTADNLTRLQAAVKEAAEFPNQAKCIISIFVAGDLKFNAAVPLTTANTYFQAQINQLKGKIADMDGKLQAISISSEAKATPTG